MGGCYEGHDEEGGDFENSAAEGSGSSAGMSSEGDAEEGYSGPSEVAAAAAAVVFGSSAGVHFADVPSVCEVGCSPAFAERDSEMLQHAAAVHSAEEVQDSERFAEGCSVNVEGLWV